MLTHEISGKNLQLGELKMWRILVPGSPGQPHPGQTDARSSGEKQHLHSVIYANTYYYMVGGLQNTTHNGSFIELERDGMGAPAQALTLHHHVE